MVEENSTNFEIILQIQMVTDHYWVSHGHHDKY